MKRDWRSTVLLGVLVLFAVTTSAGAQTPVTRPLKMTGVLQETIYSNGDFVAHSSGEATHLGKFTGYGSGNMADATAPGVFIAANGHQVTFGGSPAAPTFYTITGGTGRFQGATGAYSVTSDVQSIVVNPDGSMTINLKWTAVGTITY